MFRLIVVIFSFAFFGGISAFVAKDRVIGGVEASILNYPFQCSIQKLENHACGCSVYSKNVVLTAAHCLVGATQSDINHMQVRAGSNLWSTGGVVRKVDSILIHPSYDTETMANDVALVKLQSELVFGNKLKPVKLATSYPAAGSDVVITGWGYKKEDVRAMVPKLQEVNVKYTSGKTCSSSLYKYNNEIKDGMICGVGENADACQGDSGGPLTVPGSGDQIGIVSWGYGCAQPGYPGIYSDIVYYGPWIKKNANAF